MDFRQLMVKTKQRFIRRECLVFKPIARVSQKLGNPLNDLLRIATDIPFRLAVDTCPFPDIVEHATMQFAGVRFAEWIHGLHRSVVERPLPGRYNVQGFVFVQLAYGADPGDQLFGLIRPNWSIPVRVFFIEDEVHRVLRRFKRRSVSSLISWSAFCGFWSSNAIV